MLLSYKELMLKKIPYKDIIFIWEGQRKKGKGKYALNTFEKLFYQYLLFKAFAENM